MGKKETFCSELGDGEVKDPRGSPALHSIAPGCWHLAVWWLLPWAEMEDGGGKEQRGLSQGKFLICKG